jgi:hypothetical protein
MSDQLEVPPYFHVPHDIDEAERVIKQRLADLHREYTELCRPYFQMLTKIEMMRPARPVWFDLRTLDQYQYENLRKLCDPSLTESDLIGGES